MTYAVERRMLPLQCTAVVSGTVATGGISRWLQGAYQEVSSYLTRAGVTPVGPPFARYTFHGDNVDVEAGFPVPFPVPGAGRVEPSTLPAGPAASTAHYGPFEQLTAAYDAIIRWLKDQGYEANGAAWETYFTDPQAEPDPARWRTDIAMPYRAG